MKRRRLIIIVSVTVGYVLYQLLTPILLPFLGIVISLNAIFNHDLMWEMQIRGSRRFGLPMGERTPGWDRLLTLCGGALLAVIVVAFAMPFVS